MATRLSWLSACFRSEPAPSGWRRWAARLLIWSAGLYLVAAFSLWYLLATAVDRWWPVTVLAFSPRWLLGVPLFALVPVSVLLRCRSAGVSIVGLALLVGPIMGLCIPWTNLWPGGAAPFSLRVLTCNVHRLVQTPDLLRDLIRSTRPDVVAVQEWSSQHEQTLFGSGGWQVRRDGELFVASRLPLAGGEVLFARTPSQEGSAASVALGAPIGHIPLFNVHLASPHHALEEILHGNREGIELLEDNGRQREAQSALVSGAAAWRGAQRAILVGDFNTPPESLVYQRHWSSFENAFSAAGWGWGYTYQTRRLRIRIDHVLAGRGWRCRRCWLGPNVGTPHHPVLADLEWADGTN